MIPKTPEIYLELIAEVTSIREEANRDKAKIDKDVDLAIEFVSKKLVALRDSCTHNGKILLKESTTGRPHDPDIYVCSLCTGTLQRPPISAEIVRVSQDELMKFFCK